MGTAVTAAQRTGDLAAEACARRRLAGAYQFLGRDAESRAELNRSDEILAALGHPAGTVHLHACLDL